MKAIVALGAAAWLVFASAVAAEAPTGRLIVHLDWPADVVPQDIHLRVCRVVDEKVEWVSDSLRLREGKVTLENLPVGTYKYAIDEADAAQYGVDVLGEAELPEEGAAVEVESRVSPGETVEVSVRVLRQLDGAPLAADVEWWRVPWNPNGTIVRVGGNTVRMVLGAQYWMEATPPSGLRAKPVAVGPFNPAEFAKEGLTLGVPTERPSLRVRGVIGEGVREKVNAEQWQVWTFWRQVQEDGSLKDVTSNLNRSRISTSFCAAELLKPAVGRYEDIYDIPDGTYEVDAWMSRNGFLNDVLMAESPLRVVVQDRIGNPNEVELVFSEKRTGTFLISVSGRQGEPLFGGRAFVRLPDGNQVWEGETDERGKVSSNRFPVGSYSVIVAAKGLPVLRREVVLAPGITQFEFGYARVVDLEVELLDDREKPAPTDLRYFRALDAANDGYSQPNELGRLTAALLPEDFPLLLQFTPESDELASTFSIVERPQTGLLQYRVHSAPRFTVEAVVPSHWYRRDEMSDAGDVPLWFFRKDTLLPAEILWPRPTEAWGGRPVVTLVGTGRLDPGEYELAAQIWPEMRVLLWFGTVVVEPGKTLRVALWDDKAKARLPLPELRRAMAEHAGGN